MTIKQVSMSEAAKVGKYIIIDGVPCVVKSVQISKTGKHGHSKARVEAQGLINESVKKVFIKPMSDNIDVPIVEKETAQILSITGDTANVMDMATYETFDIKIPEEFKDQIKEGTQVMYWKLMGQKIIKQVK
ncbi:translation initiation factor IF-5A [Candidatus Woesearchaeota archaeon]|nr:translation initiation factor IF-5A [Candidatus Woesearchaeota archaeon]